MRIRLFSMLLGLAVLAAIPTAQTPSPGAKQASDSTAVQERRQLRQNVNILLGLPERSGIEAIQGKEPELGLNSTLYQKGLVLFKEGLAKYMDGDYGAATTLFKQVLDLDPLHKNTYSFLERALDEMENAKDPDKKIQRSEDAVTRKNELLFQAGLEKYLKGDYPAALRLWRNLAKSASDLEKVFTHLRMAEEKLESATRNYLNQGAFYYEQGEFEKAVAQWKEGLSLNPESEKLKLRMDAAAAERKRLSEMGVPAEAGREKLRKNEEETNRLGQSFEKGRYQMVLDTAKKLLAQNPDNAVAREIARKAARALSEPEPGGTRTPPKASPAAADSLLHRREMAEALERGMALFEKGSYSAALKELRSALVNDPGNEMLSAYIKEAEKKSGEAPAIQKKKEQDGKEAFKLNQDALKQYKEKKYGEALQSLQKAQTLEPENPTTQKAMAVTRQELLRDEERRTPEADKKADKLFYAGIDYYRKGNYKKALECWKELIVLKPGHPKAKKYIDNVSQKLEKIEKI